MRYLIAALLLVSTEVFGQSEPLFEFSQGNVRIVVYSDKCRLPEVSNIPLKAIWYENGKEIEGCIGAKDDLGVVVAYFADKTIVVLPQSVFRKVTGTKMLLTVVREPSKNGCTLGELLLDGVHEAWTVEDEIREIPGKPVSEWKVPHETAIPQGKYRVVLTQSQRFDKVLPELLNVPGYAGVRIHSGNTAAQTDGCLLIGKEKGPESVLRSREAMIEMMAALTGVSENGEQIWIEVKNPLALSE